MSNPHRSFVSWVHYLFEADVDRRCSELPPEQMGMAEGAAEHTHGFARIVKWLASLSPVIEGWRESGLQDSKVDFLIDAFPEFVGFAKRLAVRRSQFDPTILEVAMPEFFEASGDMILWGHVVHGAFVKALWESIYAGGADAVDERRQAVVDLVGWLPTDLASVMRFDADQERRKHERMLDEAGDRSSKAALELLASIEAFERIAKEQAAEWEAYERAVIERLKSKGRLQ